MDIFKMLGIDGEAVKQKGEELENRMKVMEEMQAYNADLLENICRHFQIPIPGEDATDE